MENSYQGHRRMLQHFWSLDLPVDLTPNWNNPDEADDGAAKGFFFSAGPVSVKEIILLVNMVRIEIQRYVVQYTFYRFCLLID